ncbi:amidophosphoribosyltransferase [Alloiococcus sp. CFN-8]|uniref:amidophosphoribosyltransferase n=1 Tax=Alloiococcus sp. CFN-8 TaxID=3416081 RepID=UPI003CF8CCA7
MIELVKDKFKEECGVFGIFSPDVEEVTSITYYGLYALQHRGQESAGIAVADGSNLRCEKGMGLVSEAFDKEKLGELRGNAAIGHVRYSTAGSSNLINAQPLVTESKYGTVAMAHNGNCTNAEVIRDLLEDGGHLFNTTNDSEVILSLIARGARRGIEQAVFEALQAIKGSFALVILTKDKLIGVRDTYGIRPLAIGKYKDSYILTSESCALDTIGAEFVRDVKPGEIVVIDKEGLRSVNKIERTTCNTCSFEYIYFARPDSTIDGMNVYESRVRVGEGLYKECPAEADVVIGVPDSGLAAAVGYAKASGIPYADGFIKNRYIGRTFIAPSQELREKAVALKLNPLKNIVNGKRIVLIDDSIVRGTTSVRLVELMKKAGAKEVHFRVASPIVKFPCYFGIDTPYRRELIGANKTVEEIKDMLGADSLGYISIEGMIEAFGRGDNFCLGCFSGVYPVAPPMETNKDYLER